VKASIYFASKHTGVCGGLPPPMPLLLKTVEKTFPRCISRRHTTLTEYAFAAETVNCKSDQERLWYDPKDGELYLGRAKPEETLVEARSGADVQIARPTWV